MKSLALAALTFVSLLSACSSTPSGPVTDKYTTTPFIWDNEKSEALNLLRSADIAKYFQDVNSENEFNNIRYRKSTAKSTFDYISGFVAFGVAGALNNHANHEDDKNSKFISNTYVTYIPVDKKKLTNFEQSILRDQAVARLSILLNTKGNKDNWRYHSYSRYIINLSGEVCEFIGDSYKGTPLENSPCATSVYSKVASVIDTSESKVLNVNNSKFIAVVKIAIPAPFASLIAAKNVDSDSFVALIDTYKSREVYTRISTPVVAISDRLLPFLNPRKVNNKSITDKPIEAIICARETVACYKTTVSVDKSPLIKSKIK